RRSHDPLPRPSHLRRPQRHHRRRIPLALRLRPRHVPPPPPRRPLRNHRRRHHPPLPPPTARSHPLELQLAPRTTVPQLPPSASRGLTSSSSLCPLCLCG